LVGYPSGQRGQTVNLLAYAFDGSNPSPTTTFFRKGKSVLNAIKSSVLSILKISLDAVIYFFDLLRSFTINP
jgi:hypothetical protein